MNNSQHLYERLGRGGVVKKGHFVGKSGKHLTEYVAKDEVFVDPELTFEFCKQMAHAAFATYRLNRLDELIIVGPVVGGVGLTQWVTYYARQLGANCKAIFADEEKIIVKPSIGELLSTGDGQQIRVEEGMTFAQLTGRFVIKRSYPEHVEGKKVFIVDDILTTGTSVSEVADAVRRVGGDPVGAAVMWNRGKASAAAARVPTLESVLDVELPSFTEEECARSGPCSQGIEIDTKHGHGKEFLARRANKDGAASA